MSNVQIWWTEPSIQLNNILLKYQTKYLLMMSVTVSGTTESDNMAQIKKNTGNMPVDSHLPYSLHKRIKLTTRMKKKRSNLVVL